MRVNGKFSPHADRTRWFGPAWASLTAFAVVISSCTPITLASSYFRAYELPAIASEPKPSLVTTSGERGALDSLARLPLRFEACGGQAPARYLARMSGSAIYLSATEATFLLRAPASAGRLGRGANLGTPRNARSPQANEQLPEPRRDRAAPRRPAAATVRMQLIGANPRARVVGEEQLPARTSCFIGKDATQWRTDVPNYARVKVEQAYRGIDVVYYGSGQQQLEYDFKVAPGADFKAICLRAFQTVFGGGAQDAFVTKLNSTGTALVYSTLLGGKNKGNTDGNDQGFAIAVDSAGNAYVTILEAQMAGSPGPRSKRDCPALFPTW